VGDLPDVEDVPGPYGPVIVVSRGLRGMIYDFTDEEAAAGANRRPSNPQHQYKTRCPGLDDQIKFVVVEYLKGKITIDPVMLALGDL